MYHVSSPNLQNETVLVAGAGLENASAALCTHEQSGCTAVDVDSWERSAKVVLPATGCGPPCFLNLSTANGSAVVQLNRPDVWWATTATPAAHPGGGAVAHTIPTEAVVATVVMGEQLRVFGRSLAWTGSRCTDGSKPPEPHAHTTLQTQQPGALQLPSLSASCYEATFATDTLQAGEQNVSVETEWGRSVPFMLRKSRD